MLRSFEEKIFAHRKGWRSQKYFVYFKIVTRCCGEKDSFKTVQIPMGTRLKPWFYDMLHRKRYFGILAKYPCIRQIIHNNDFMTGIQQFDCGMAADITGTAGN